jgi:mannose-6-phosphate isomerase-like protein (cupin superfamily)
MQAVQSAEIEAYQFATHREGEIKFQRLLQGDPSALNNFEWSIVRAGEDYGTPRHHHNFSQIHYVLEGTHEWAPDRLLPTGSVTYFPEGTFYGPQQGHGALLLGLQYGEASAAGFMSYDRLAEGNKRLAEHPNGEFDGGTYRSVDANGKQRNQDGYEAIWEEIHGRPVEYPAPRYETPITMHPDGFSWVPSADETGIAHKHLGTFSERRTSVGFTRYDAGATHRVCDLRAPELHFVLDGALRCHDGVFGTWTAFQFDPGDNETLEAIEATTTYVIGLPIFD